MWWWWWWWWCGDRRYATMHFDHLLPQKVEMPFPGADAHGVLLQHRQQPEADKKS